MRALVIGGGIGGLAAATALRRAGHEVTVFERAERFGEVGGGLAISANALAALAALGHRETALAQGALGNRLLVRAAAGTPLADVRLEPGKESLGIHRAALLDVLREGAGAVDVRLGAVCTSVSQDPTGVSATFGDGSVERGDFLVGADGIGSIVRTTLFGVEPARFAGYVGWRAIASADPQLIDRGVFWETWGRGVRFGCVEIGGGRIYWFVADSATEDAPEPPAGPKRAFLDRFHAWHAPIVRIIEATPEDALTRTLIYDRKPIDRWGKGRITLLGDAAHPMTPNLGQGASQALEDAAVLGALAKDDSDPATFLRAYERRRVARANMIVRRSRQVGRVAQARNPLVCALRDRVLRLTPARVQQAQQTKLLAFEV